MPVDRSERAGASTISLCANVRETPNLERLDDVEVGAETTAEALEVQRPCLTSVLRKPSYMRSKPNRRLQAHRIY